MSEQPPAEEPKKEEAPAEAQAEQPPAEGEEGAQEEAQEEEDPNVFKMGEEEFYPEEHIEKAFQDSELSRRTMRFYNCYGLTSFKRYNFHWLGDNSFIFTTGNTYQIWDIVTGEKRTFHGTDVDGVGAIAVHPSYQYIAVAEKGTYPNIYIYEYPSLKLYRVLRRGTEKMYAHVEFSIFSKGELLASLGGAPDFTITIWNWKNEKVVLKNKAFGAEVYRVQFSPYTDNVLFTMGSIHIRFWQMAQTFTGLKLQQETAKFGQLELSNVACVAELPDGKVVSGTEQGNLIVWEGQFIKSHLMLDDVKKTPLHQGMVEILIQDDEYFISAGADGYIKWWRMSEIDAAEAEEGLDFPIAPVKEVLISENGEGKNPAYIQNMVLADGKWYIQDRKGRLYVMEKNENTYKCITEFHEKAVTGLVSSPTHNFAVSIGENGMIKVWDFVRKVVAYQSQFLGEGTCLEGMPPSDANKGRIFAAGFNNGIVRIISVSADGIIILKSFKAHDDAIVGCKYSQDLKMFCTASVTGDIFFFNCDGMSDLQLYEPLCTVKLPDKAGITDFKWNPDDNSVIFGCDNGFVHQVRRPKPNEINSKDSYLWEDVDMQSWRIKMMEFQMQKNQKKDEAEEEKKRRMRLRGELPPEDEEEEEDWDPEKIYAILPFSDNDGQKFIVASTKQYNGFIYLCDINQIRPYKAIEIPADLHVSYMSLSKKKAADIIVIGYDNGDIQLVFDYNYDTRMSVKYHDAHTGQITSVAFNFDDTFFLTAASDGLIFAHQFDRRAAAEENKFDPFKGVEGAQFLPEDEKVQLKKKKLKEYQENNPPVFNPITDDTALDEAALAITIKTKEELNKDILDPTIYSIQQDKLKSEEDRRRELAEKKKDGVRIQIQDLRKGFDKIREKNEIAPQHLQISEDDFQIDPDFFMILQERNDEKINETKREVAWDNEYYEVRLAKLREKFYDVLEFEKFHVKAIKNGSYVTTFRVQKMSEHLTSNIEAFKQLLENEIIGKDAEAEDDPLDEQSKDGDNQVDNEKQKEKEKAAALAAKQKAALQAELNAKKTEHERKREARKLEREERKKKIEKLDKKVAMHSGEDPADRKEIDIAKATYGDKELKISSDYKVPENERVNYQKKRQQMVLLEGSIHKLKVDFNQKIQELKLRKKEIIDHVQKVNERLQEINLELGDKEELFVPQIDQLTEEPDKYFDIKPEEIEQYKKDLEKKKAAEKSAKKGGKKGKQQEEQPEEAADEDEEKLKSAREEKFDIMKAQSALRKNPKVQQTDFDDEFNQIRKIELTYERDNKKKEIDEIYAQFDEEVKEMQKEKYRLESDLKNAEMKLVLYFEELILLRQMEGKDIQLTNRLAACRSEKGKILKEINEISRKLKEKKKEIDGIKEKEEDLMAKFHEYCPERSEKYEEIRKFFEKIIKKKKKKPEKVEKVEGDEDDEEEEDEEDEEEDDDEDEDEDENTITGLTQEDNKIEEIEKLRDERLELYEDREKIKDFIDNLESQRKKLESKERNIKTENEETEEEIQDFQSEKLSKMNELKIPITLKIKQIQNLVPDNERVEFYKEIRQQEIEKQMAELEAKIEEQQIDDQEYIQKKRMDLEREDDWRGYYLPKNLDKSIMFTRTQLLQLIKRKRELDEQQISLKKNYVEYQRTNKQNKKEIKENEKIREIKEREYNERQMLRFGNLVDLDNLEVSGPSSAVIEAEKKYEKTERKCQQRIEEALADFERTQRELTSQIKENTNLLNLIRKLGEEELDLDKKLNDSNKAIFVDEDEEKKKHILEEKMKIKKLLEIQAKEIETFKTEINMYKRKGGHIYTKVTTNRRVANLNQDN